MIRRKKDGGYNYGVTLRHCWARWKKQIFTSKAGLNGELNNEETGTASKTDYKPEML